MAAQQPRDFSGPAHEALNYTLNALVLGAFDRPMDIVTSGMGVAPALVLNRVSQGAAAVLDPPGPSTDPILRTIINAADSSEATNAGNCWEHAAVAFRYLYRRNIKPTALLSRPNHAFVMLGYDHRTDFSNPSTFPATAWIVDGWRRVTYPARQYLCYESERADLYYRYD